MPLFLPRFFAASSYKDFLERATAFNRKLNEERKMRIPYIDGQTGVAQRHYGNQRLPRERMPPNQLKRPGQILSYPQKQWKKKRYQYLKFFMQPRSRFDPDSEMHTISQIENPSLNEDSNGSSSGPGGGAAAAGGGPADAMAAGLPASGPSAHGAKGEDGKVSVRPSWARKSRQTLISE